MLYLVVVFLSYLAFVFISESFQPIIKPSNPIARRRWRLGRWVAFASAVCGVAAIYAGTVYSISSGLQAAIFMMGTAMLSVPGYVRYRKGGLFG